MQSVPRVEAASVPRVTRVDPALFAQHNGCKYRTPTDLQATPDSALRFLAVGGCFAEPFPEVAAMINREFKGDFILLNNFDAFPEIPAARRLQYDFQIVHTPLRTILGSAFFRLPDDGSQHEEFLRQTEDYLARYLSNALELNREHKLLTFVLGFLVPQQNPLGRFAPRYDLRNIMHFVERLNVFLATEAGKHENAYFIDIDLVSGSIGKKFCQDDMVWSFTHGTTLSDGDHGHDLDRIEPPASMQHYYSARWLEFFEAVLLEIFAMHRTLKQQDTVKLVVVDLDDTLWRGVAAEGTLGILEGWPMGFMETLLCLKKRGILLAIVSKNDEQFIQSNWNEIVHGQIALTDFAACKINFRSKVRNLSEILHEISLRPENAVLIDDNPVERAAIQAGLPGVRVLGSQVYYLKRILLWSPETQRPALTEESGRKTEMVRAQIERESVRRQLSDQEFLETLQLLVSISILRGTSNLHTRRALELFNKTNQFNTTGARYTLEQWHQYFLAGRQLYVLHAEDRFTNYGLVGAAWVNQNCIDHLVMSCRALGLDVEDAFLAQIGDRLARQDATVMLGRLLPTDANVACRELYRQNGFTQSPDDSSLWSRPLRQPLVVPRHIFLSAPEVQDMGVLGEPSFAGRMSANPQSPAPRNGLLLEPSADGLPLGTVSSPRNDPSDHVPLHR